MASSMYPWEGTITPKGPSNPYGSVTGPHNSAGGFGEPAGEGDTCPKCGSSSFHFEQGWLDSASNKCTDCGYNESFSF